MIFLYALGIFVCMILAVYFLMCRHSLSKKKEEFQTYQKEILKYNSQLDDLHEQMVQSDEILGKISHLSLKILDYRK